MSDATGVQQVYELAVVGAGGFLGSAVMRAASAAGIGAVGFDRDTPAVRAGVLDPSLRGVRAVAWCASRVNPRLALDDPHLVEQDRHDLQSFVDLLLDLDTDTQMVLLSSGGTVYGPPALPPYAEHMAPHPVNAYGEAKLLMEETLRGSGLRGTSLRVSNAYGPGQRPAPGQGVLAHWMTAIRESAPVVLYGDPLSTRDYVYVDDIARAVIAASVAVNVPDVVNIGSGNATTLDQLLAALERAVAPHSVDVRRSEARSTDADHSVLDVTLARDALGWSPQVDLDEGVRTMWRSFNA